MDKLSRFASLFWALCLNEIRTSVATCSQIELLRGSMSELAGSCSIKTPIEKGAVYSKVSAPTTLKRIHKYTLYRTKGQGMSLSQQFLDKEDKKSNVYLNSDYAQLRVNIFKILNELDYSEKQVEFVTEDILEIVDKFLKENT